MALRRRCSTVRVWSPATWWPWRRRPHRLRPRGISHQVEVIHRPRTLLTFCSSSENHGAGNEARTRDLNLGKVALYQLSYSRPKQTRNCRAEPPVVKKNRQRNAAKALNQPAIPSQQDSCRRCRLLRLASWIWRLFTHGEYRGKLQFGAPPKFRPRQAQVLDHGPKGQNRRDRGQQQSQLIGRNDEKILAK